VRSDGFAWRIVRYASESRARDLSQFFSAGDALAIHRNPSGNLNGFLHPLNRDFGADFDPANFQHRRFSETVASRIEALGEYPRPARMLAAPDADLHIA
jgi:hypothetical protein